MANVEATGQLMIGSDCEADWDSSFSSSSFQLTPGRRAENKQPVYVFHVSHKQQEVLHATHTPSLVSICQSKLKLLRENWISYFKQPCIKTYLYNGTGMFSYLSYKIIKSLRELFITYSKLKFKLSVHVKTGGWGYCDHTLLVSGHVYKPYHWFKLWICCRFIFYHEQWSLFSLVGKKYRYLIF